MWYQGLWQRPSCAFGLVGFWWRDVGGGGSVALWDGRRGQAAVWGAAWARRKGL